MDLCMIDRDRLLCRCMHGGPVPLPDARQAIPDVSQEVVEGWVSTAVARFGSCAVLAVDDAQIVGVLWFYPAEVKQLFGGPICVQGDNYDALRDFDPADLPPQEQLTDLTLEIECVMLARAPTADYTGRGLARRMVLHLIDWARERGWARIAARTIPEIQPLLLWYGAYSVDRYRALGFRVTGDELCPGLLEGADSQKAGAHGPAFQAMWERYAGLSDDQIARVYRVVLAL